MAEHGITARIDQIRQDIEKLLAAPGLPPKRKAALTEILQLLSEAADTAEDAKL